MRVSGCVAAVCVTACLVLALPAKALADARDQETVFTFSGDIEIPGKVLRAGTYVFRIADTVVDRHMVLVFDRTGRFVAMTLTVAATRLSATDGTQVTFEARSAGTPSPLKQWFYPGKLTGEEFVYRRHWAP